MNRTKSGNRRSSAKRKGPSTSVEEYLSRISEPARGSLKKMRAAIRSAVPREATETISYGIPAFKTKKVLVWFAGFSDHCSLFPTASVVEKFKSQLKGFSTSRGTIHFPLEKPLPLALIKKIVKARVAQIESEQRA